MDWYDDDEIGYCRPPRYTQFKKGQSGNPKGRPRKQKKPKTPPATDYDERLHQLYNRKVSVTVGGKKKQVAAFEAVAMRQEVDALSGSVTAQRELLRTKERLAERNARRRLEQAEQEKQEAIARKQDQLSIYDYLVALHAKQTKVYEDAARMGSDPVSRYPHPDDFAFDHKVKKAAIHGPFDEDDLPYFLRLEKRRDYHLIDHTILCRQRPKGSKFHQQLSLFQVCSYDALLPTRLRLTSERLEAHLDLLFALPMRELRTWRDDAARWIELNPLPELGKEGRRDVYKTVNSVMTPYLEPLGFRSLAQFERHLEDQKEQEKLGAGEQ